MPHQRTVSVSLAAVITLLSATCLHAQGMGKLEQPKLGTEVYAMMLGDVAFSATCQMSINDTTSGRAMEVDVPYAVRDGKVRIEFDMAQLAGQSQSPQAAAQMKKMGMDRVISVHDSRSGKTLVVYPGLKGYVETTDPQAAVGASPAIKREVLGKEKVDGHPCTKVKLTAENSRGRQGSVLMWEATDLGNLPIKIVAEENGTTSTMTFKNIDRTTPKASLFTAAGNCKGCKGYPSVQALMMANMQRFMPQGR